MFALCCIIFFSGSLDMIFNHHIPRIESHLKFLIASINFVPTSKFQIRRRGEIQRNFNRNREIKFTKFYARFLGGTSRKILSYPTTIPSRTNRAELIWSRPFFPLIRKPTCAPLTIFLRPTKDYGDY